MRDRSRASSRHPRSTGLRAPHSALDGVVPEVARQFAPEQIDLDQLAEAIRSLLGEPNEPRPQAPAAPNPDLLLVRRRGSHVVRAKTKP